MESNFSLIMLFSIVSVAMGFTVSVLLWYFSKNNKANRFLSIAIFSLSYALFIGVLIESELIEKIPHIYRTGNAFALVYISFSYLYIRGVVRKRGFDKTDLIHLIPMLLYVVDYMPFYLLSSHEKIQIYNQSMPNLSSVILFNEGWIFPKGFHVPARTTLEAIYWFIQLFMLIQFYNNDQRVGRREFIPWRNWIIGFMTLQVISFLPYYIGLVLELDGLQWVIIHSTGSIILMFTAVSLLFSPKILYGLRLEGLTNERIKRNLKKVKPNSATNSKNSNKMIKDDIDEINTNNQSLNKTIIEFIQSEKPYLKAGYALHDLAKDLSVHPHQLSIFLNKEIGQSFSDMINQYRIKFCISQLEEGKMRNLKLEALASDCGFNNRNSFTSAFKRFTGQTPSQYISLLKT